MSLTVLVNPVFSQTHSFETKTHLQFQQTEIFSTEMCFFVSHLLPDGLKQVVVQRDRLHRVPQAEEGGAVDGGQAVAGEVHGAEVAEGGKLRMRDTKCVNISSLGEIVCAKIMAFFLGGQTFIVRKLGKFHYA